MVKALEHVEYVLDGTKTYLLYDNMVQNKLLAMAYDEEDIKEESKHYLDGVWFECDNIQDTNGFTNEKKYGKKVKFPEEPELRPIQLELLEQFKFNSKVGDIR